MKLSDERMRQTVREEGLEAFRPELDSAPRVYYKNLHRMNRRFVAGSVVRVNGGVQDCLQGCTVTLLQDGAQIAQTVTDRFGDFKIDRLPDESVSYTLVFEHPWHEAGLPRVR